MCSGCRHNEAVLTTQRLYTTHNSPNIDVGCHKSDRFTMMRECGESAIRSDDPTPSTSNSSGEWRAEAYHDQSSISSLQQSTFNYSDKPDSTTPPQAKATFSKGFLIQCIL
jgi:hypothetical protein